MNLKQITQKTADRMKAAGAQVAGKAAAAGAVLASWRPDALLITGAGGVSYGAWLVYEPAGFIVGGMLVMLAGAIDSRGAQ